MYFALSCFCLPTSFLALTRKSSTVGNDENFEDPKKATVTCVKAAGLIGANVVTLQDDQRYCSRRNSILPESTDTRLRDETFSIPSAAAMITRNEPCNLQALTTTVR